jgi:DNA-binding NarL/FixJ family response regulator
MAGYRAVDRNELHRLIAPAVDELRLSPRLREVFVALGAGLRAGEIATAFGISKHTAATEIKELYRRLGVSGHRALRSIILMMVMDVARQPPPRSGCGMRMQRSSIT